MRNVLKSALSMESASAVAVEETNDLATSLALESATLSIEESGNALDMVNYEQMELETAATSLEGIATAIESSMESNEAGLTQGEARGYSLAVEAVLGGALPNPVASMESFGGETERRQATELSMEGLQDSIKKIWEAIKRTIQKVISAVVDFFAKLFGGVEKAKKKAQELQAKLKDLKGASAKEAKFKAAGLDRIAIEGKVDPKTLLEGAESVKALADAGGQVAAVYVDYMKSVVAYFKAKSEDVEELVKATKEANEDLRKVEVLEKEMELPGGKVIMAADSEKEEDGMPKLIAPELVDHPKAKAYKADKDGIDALDAGQIEKILDVVIAALDGMDKDKKVRESMVELQKSALESADKFAKEVEGGKLAFVEQSWDRVKLRWVLSRAKGSMTSFVGKMDRYSFSIARGYLSVAEAAIANLGEEKKEADAE